MLGGVFLNMDREAPALASHMGVMPDHLQKFSLENRYIDLYFSRELDWNWETAFAAFLEAYHVTGGQIPGQLSQPAATAGQVRAGTCGTAEDWRLRLRWTSPSGSGAGDLELATGAGKSGRDNSDGASPSNSVRARAASGQGVESAIRWRKASFTINLLSYYLLTEGLMRRGQLRMPGGLVINMTSGGGHNAPLGTAFLHVTAPAKFNGTVIGDCREIVRLILDSLEAENYAIAVELANTPDQIRAFGHVMERNIEAVRYERIGQLEKFRSRRVPDVTLVDA